MSESSSAAPAGPAPDRDPGSPSGLERAAASRTLVELIIGFQLSRVIGVAAELGIADLLAEGSLSVEHLAALTNTRAPLLYRMLRALASRGIFAELEDGRFAMTPLADPLRSSAPGGSVRAYAVFASQAFAQRPWEQMLATLRTGQPGFDQVYGAPLFEYLAADAAAGEIFNEAMTSNAAVRRKRWSRRTTSQDCVRSSTSLEDTRSRQHPQV
jgi:hypothetical protein